MNSSLKIFAASNGYGGFKSYFGEIFNPDEYERLYIIKGGPGTGKSSLMKKYAESMAARGLDVIRIYCSSDPSSLDGVIAYNGSLRVGIIDGTAPHTRDTSYPGAVDVILDLGQSFDLPTLAAHREEIKELARAKARSYREAYEHLGLAGKEAQAENEKISALSTYNAAEMLSINKLKCLIKPCEGDEFIIPGSIFPISSFSRDGYQTYVPTSFFGKETVKLTTRGETEALLSRLYEGEEGVIALCPSALSEGLAEGLLSEKKMYIIKPEELDYTDNAAYFEAMELAKKSLSKASELHFRLEEIYSPLVDFTLHARLLKKITEESLALFDKKPLGH